MEGGTLQARVASFRRFACQADSLMTRHVAGHAGTSLLSQFVAADQTAETVANRRANQVNLLRSWTQIFMRFCGLTMHIRQLEG